MNIYPSITWEEVFMRATPLTLILILLLAVLPLAISSSLAEPGLPTLSVTIEPIGEVETDLMEYVQVQATANVSVSNFPLGALVNVTATAGTWMVTVTPSSFEVPQGSTEHNETVSINIEIPPRASADRDMELRVFANTTTTQGIEYSDMAFTNISVKQYYGLKLSQNGTMVVHQGSNTTHRMRVSNMGNGIDDYNVTLTNQANITSKGLDVEHDEYIYELDENRVTSVAILVTAATDAETGTVTAYFRVTSVGDTSKSMDYHVTITVVSGNNPPVANASILEDPDDLWTNMSIHFSSNGSYDDEGDIRFSWDFDDGMDPSTLANPIHAYEEPGTYNVTLTVTDQNDTTARYTLTLTIQRNYGDTDIVKKAVEPNTQSAFFDPPQGESEQVAVKRAGWVAYLCELEGDQEVVVRVTIIGDRPADIFLFEEVHFMTYKRNPQVTFVPFMADGLKLNATGVFNYSFTASEADRYYIVIDNKDFPLGTDTEGPVDYNIIIESDFQPMVANVTILEDPDDLWPNMSIHLSSNRTYDIDDEGSISFTWDFGDGTDPNILANPIHVYKEPGTYTVTLTVTDQEKVIAQETLVLTIQGNYDESEDDNRTYVLLGVIAALAVLATVCVVVVFYRRREM